MGAAVVMASSLWPPRSPRKTAAGEQRLRETSRKATSHVPVPHPGSDICHVKAEKTSHMNSMSSLAGVTDGAGSLLKQLSARSRISAKSSLP